MCPRWCFCCLYNLMLTRKVYTGTRRYTRRAPSVNAGTGNSKSGSAAVAAPPDQATKSLEIREKRTKISLTVDFGLYQP